MRPALRILFGLLQGEIRSQPALTESIKLHFVGTDYATDSRARKTVEPVAREAGVDSLVNERTVEFHTSRHCNS